MKKIIKTISVFVLIVVFLDLFAYSVRHVTKGGTSLGVFSKPLRIFSEFPILIKSVFKEIKHPERLIDVSPDFKSINDLDYDAYALYSHFKDKKWIINLTNLKNDSIIYSWHLKEKDYNNSSMSTKIIFSHARPLLPLLLNDTSIIININETHNLYRIDKQSNIIWHNTDYSFHHSINPDIDRNIWACTQTFDKPNQSERIIDDYLIKIDSRNGNTLFRKSIREIFVENGLGYMAYGSFLSNDPFHLNDIQPVLKDRPYWKTGDLFISLRNKSMVLLYRPSTNKILRIIRGGCYYQHDVDIESDSTITIFNNNVSRLPLYSTSEKGDTFQYTLPNPTFNQTSQVVMYNFKDSTFTTIYPKQFIENKIYTKTEGLHHIFPNGDMFVENTTQGIVYIFNKDKVFLKKYYNPIVNGMTERTHWIRIYEDINFLKD